MLIPLNQTKNRGKGKQLVIKELQCENTGTINDNVDDSVDWGPVLSLLRTSSFTFNERQ